MHAEFLKLMLKMNPPSRIGSFHALMAGLADWSAWGGWQLRES